MIQTKHNQT